MEKNTPKNIDEYISRYPREIQTILKTIRETIKIAAPDATEAISYQIPTFKMGENLVHFAAFKDHISFFPTSSGVFNFIDELKNYGISKGTIRFPLDKPIPYELITKITEFRVKEVNEKRRKKIEGRKRKLPGDTGNYCEFDFQITGYEAYLITGIYQSRGRWDRP